MESKITRIFGGKGGAKGSMTATKSVVTTVTLELSLECAQWLKSYMQNSFVSPEQEGAESRLLHREYREGLFNALHKLDI